MSDKQFKTIYILYQLWLNIERRHKLYFLMLIFVMVLSAVAEIISIGSLIPFMEVLITKDGVNKYQVVFSQYLPSLHLDTDSIKRLILAGFCIAIFISGGLKMMLLLMNSRLAFLIGADLGRKIYTRTLFQPYLVHIARSSSEIITGITQKTSAVTHNAVAPAINIFSAVIIMLGILITIFIINPVITISLFWGILAIYFMWMMRISQRLKVNSQIISVESTFVLKSLREGLGSIRDVLLSGAQEFYVKRYADSNYRLHRAQAANLFLSSSPRYVIETSGMMVLGLFGYVIISVNDEAQIESFIPALGAITLGIQKLLPFAQQIYGGIASMKGSEASLSDALVLLKQPLPEYLNLKNRNSIVLTKSIELENIRFKYPSSDREVLKGVSLIIQKGEKIGLIGETGSGKSSLSDILMGFLEPNKGLIKVDGIAINAENSYEWQAEIAHVPQSIFFSDATVLENITMSEPRDSIDRERLNDVLRISQLNEVINSLPDGINTVIGERGVRLSGGQRQRIGIARALYKRAQLLIMDEATNALDSKTELKVIQSIFKSNPDMTIVMVTHRESALLNCNRIIEISNGHAVERFNVSSQN